MPNVGIEARERLSVDSAAQPEHRLDANARQVRFSPRVANGEHRDLVASARQFLDIFERVGFHPANVGRKFRTDNGDTHESLEWTASLPTYRFCGTHLGSGVSVGADLATADVRAPHVTQTRAGKR